MDLHTLPYVVVDVETTGGQPWGVDRVTEVAAVHVDGAAVSVAFHSLINPGRPIPWHITRLTGIDDAMWLEAPRFEDVSGELAAGPVGTMGARSQAHHQHACARISKPGNRLPPVIPIQICLALDPGDFFSPRNEARAQTAIDDGGIQRIEGHWGGEGRLEK